MTTPEIGRQDYLEGNVPAGCGRGASPGARTLMKVVAEVLDALR